MSSFISEVGAAMVTGGRVAAERGREEDRADDEGRDPTATRLSRCERYEAFQPFLRPQYKLRWLTKRELR